MNEITEISKVAVDRYFNTLALFGYKNYTDVYKLLALLYIEELLTQQAYSGFISEEDYRVIMDALYCLTGSTCLIPYPEFINNDSLIHETLRNYIPRVIQDSNLRYTEESNPRVSTDNTRFLECDGVNCLKLSHTHLEWGVDDFEQKKITIQAHAIHGDITCSCR